MNTSEKVKAPVIRDKAFADRLETACEGNPHCPTEQYRGKQKWVYDNLEEQFGIKVSPEAVRKWFAGESRPRPKVMSKIAQLLEVDEAWLSIGTKPDLLPQEKKVRNALADGAVNVVTGLIQMLGGHIAFPEKPDTSADLFAIIGGRQREIVVRTAMSTGRGKHRFTVDKSAKGTTVIGMVPIVGTIAFTLLRIPFEEIETHGNLRGDFYEFEVKQQGESFKLGAIALSKIEKLKDFC